jgi:hypothetical protein
MNQVECGRIAVWGGCEECLINSHFQSVLRKLDDDGKFHPDSRSGEAYEHCDSIELGLSGRALTAVPGKERGIAAPEPPFSLLVANAWMRLAARQQREAAHWRGGGNS